jgi:hypothetical protein
MILSSCWSEWTLYCTSRHILHCTVPPDICYTVLYLQTYITLYCTSRHMLHCAVPPDIYYTVLYLQTYVTLCCTSRHMLHCTVPPDICYTVLYLQTYVTLCCTSRHILHCTVPIALQAVSKFFLHLWFSLFLNSQYGSVDCVGLDMCREWNSQTSVVYEFGNNKTKR